MLAGLVSARIDGALPEAVVGRLWSTQVSASGVKVRVCAGALFTTIGTVFEAESPLPSLTVSSAV